jgi:aminoglycoside 3-N-acetyltransferase
VKPNVRKEDIVSGLEEVGLETGDTVLFHSSLSSMGYVQGGASTVIEAFLAAAGETGTVVVPTLRMYDWDNSSREEIEESWDIHRSPSFVGTIPEIFRKRKESIRSDNATHSVAAIGRLAVEITKDHGRAHGRDGPYLKNWPSKGAFGVGSPWEKLYRLNARYVFLGVTFKVCTMFHYVQAVLVEDHLRKKNKKVSWPRFDFTELGGELERRGLVRFSRVGSAVLRAIEAKTLVEVSLLLLEKRFLGG